MKLLVLRDSEDGSLHAYKIGGRVPNIEEFVGNFGDAALFDTDIEQGLQLDSEYGVKLGSLGQVINGKLVK